MTDKRVHISVGLRLLALVCRICPCCVITRRWPDSRFAKSYRKIQNHCPFDGAYEKVNQINISSEREQAQQEQAGRAEQK